MNRIYTTKTPSLKATIADIRNLDVKKMSLNGKNILEYIKESSTIILDERGTKANDELDIWNSYVTKDENGNVIINRSAKPFAHTYETISSTQKTTIRSAIKVIDNEVLGANDEHIMYWQTDGLTAGTGMFSYCNNLKSFNSDLSSLTSGEYMFMYCSELISFNGDLPSLTNGEYMFSNCVDLASFNSDLSSLIDGKYMFYECNRIPKFTSDLSSLTNGEKMFYGCDKLTSFNSDLSSLTFGGAMFNWCEKLTSFNSDLSSLTSGYMMFAGCYNLTAFDADLSSLTSGYMMFANCHTLTSFNSDLPSLTDGEYMFSYCKLDAPSVANIIHFIPQRDAKPTSIDGDGNICIGIGITNTDAAKQAFAEECDCNTWADLNKEFDDKNWGVEWQFNGEATTFDLRAEKPSTAVYTKLEEVFLPTEEEIAAAKEKGERIETPHYQYTSQDGDNYYNIHWYHDSNTNNEGYDYFESLEMATLAYSVIPKD